MPKPKLPYLNTEESRHGKLVYYVRLGKGPRIRLRAAYGTPEFRAEYLAALEGAPLQGPARRVQKGSLQWLWDTYRQTDAWLSLAASTRKQRENIMVHVLETAATTSFSAIRKSHIVAGLDRRATTPAAARNFLDTMKGMFGWAHERELVKEDPTDVRPPKRRKTGGFPVWTREDVLRYQEKYPLGTRQRVWLDVLLYTGPRRGDASIIGKQHVREVRNEDGSISKVLQFRTEKSGKTIAVTIPVLPILQRTLDAGPIGDLTWIVGARGLPFTKESFGNEFSAAARAAGIKKSAHGVRKIAATIAAENGATAHQLMAIFGWTNIRQAQVYTEAAERARLAAQAISTLDETGTSTPAPSQEVRAVGEIP